MGDKENVGSQKAKPKIRATDQKGKKSSTVDLELPEEELNKAAGGAATGMASWSCPDVSGAGRRNGLSLFSSDFISGSSSNSRFCLCARAYG